MASPFQSNGPIGQQTDDILATQKLLRTTLDSSMDMIQVFEAVRNQQGEIIDFTWILNNHAAEKIYGDVVGKSLLQRHPGVVEEGIFDAFKHVVETGLPQQYEKQYTHEQFDGWFYQSVVKLNDGVATTTTDITSRKKAEQQLREGKTLLQDVIDAPRIGMAVYKAVRNNKGEIIDFVHEYINRASLTMLGGDDFTGRLFTSHGENAVLQLPQFIDVIQSGKANAYTRKADFRGQQVWFAITNTPLGEDRLVHTWEDVTERKTAEAEILRLNDEIAQKATDKYRVLFETIDSGFAVLELVFDRHGEIADLIYREANAAFEQHTGLANANGKRASEVFPHIEQGWFDALKRVYQTGVPERTEGYNVDTQRWLNAHYSRVGGAGSPFIAAVFQDITERKQRETSRELLISIAQDLGQLTDETEIIHSVGAKLAAHLGINCYHYVDIDEDRDQVTVRHFWHALEVTPILGTYPLRAFVSPEALAAWRAGKPTIIHDLEREVPNGTPEAAVLKAGAAAQQISAFIATGLSQEGKWKAYFAVADSRPRTWTAVEIDLIQEVAGQLLPRIERARAEEALNERGQQLRLIADAMPALISYMDADFHYRFANQYYQHWFGLSPEEIIGKRGEEVIGDTAFEQLRPYIEAALAGQRQSFEEEVVFRYGGTRYIQSEFVPDLRPDGTVVGYYALVTDITARKLAEEGLRRSEAHLATIFQVAQVGISELDTEGRFLRVNDKLCQLLGRSPSQLLGLTLMEVTAPADIAASLTTFSQVLQTRQPVSFDNRYQQPNGTLVWANSSLSLLASKAGDSVLAITVDLTQRRLAEAALKGSEERLQKALSIRTVGVIYFDLNGTIHDANEAFIRMSGYTKGDFIQGRVRGDTLTPPEFIAATRNARQEYRTKGENTPYEKQCIRPDGSRWWGLFAGKQLSEQEYVEFVLDISDSKRAQHALEQADQRKDEFLAMLAHELRNPMATIRSGLQILSLTSLDEMAARATITSTVGMMNRQTDHLVRMLDDLLDVSRISRDKIELKTERVNLVDLVQQAVESIQPLFDQQGKTLSVNLPVAAIELVGDATRLTQVVTNLLTNGLRYTNDRGTVWLQLTQQREADGRTQAIIQVRDNGIGLAPDQRSAIFDLFVQVDNSIARAKGGMGLGLTLVKRLVELHGGDVEAQSEGLGHGSTFTVHLPTSTAAAEPTVTPAQPVTDPSALRRILVIDDNADAAFMLAMLLKMKGYETHTQNSGRSGLEAANTLQPAAILLDISMPDLDGYATCRLIRQQAWGGDVVVIALTGYGQAEDRQRSKEAGFDGHLVKPVDLGTLITLLTDLLDKGQSGAGLP